MKTNALNSRSTLIVSFLGLLIAGMSTLMLMKSKSSMTDKIQVEYVAWDVWGNLLYASKEHNVFVIIETKNPSTQELVNYFDPSGGDSLLHRSIDYEDRINLSTFAKDCLVIADFSGSVARFCLPEDGGLQLLRIAGVDDARDDKAADGYHVFHFSGPLPGNLVYDSIGMSGLSDEKKEALNSFTEDYVGLFKKTRQAQSKVFDLYARQGFLTGFVDLTNISATPANLSIAASGNCFGELE